MRDEANPLTLRLTNFRVPPLQPQEETTLEVPATVPACQTIPQRLFAAVIGPNDSSFDNSGCHVPVQVLPANPDLVVEELSAPDQVVRGESFRVTGYVRNAGVRPAFGPIDLGVWLSLDRVPVNGNDLGVGAFNLDLGSSLAPGERRYFSFQTLRVPGHAIPTSQHVIVCADVGAPPCARICELDETNNTATRPVAVAGPDVAITSVQCLSRLIGGNDPGTYRVGFANRGPGSGAGRISVRVEGSQGRFFLDSQPFQFGPSGSGTVDVVVATPSAFGVAGTSITGQVNACHDFVDDTPANNCRQTTVPIEVPFWDLRLSLTNGPGVVTVGGNGVTISWTVAVRNAGNITSSPTGFTLQTAVNCQQTGAPYTCMPNGFLTRGGANVLPGDTLRYTVHYFLPGTTWRQRQWIRADITSGDAILAGNAAAQAIDIR